MAGSLAGRGRFSIGRFGGAASPRRMADGGLRFRVEVAARAGVAAAPGKAA
ncbi:hypothetical protein ACFPN7_15170 [Amycolatopsis halotolerans]|uniref:hypothetical protein n=1 Tax=Amycolatopsis halotolerans TaxID=330083 RepID=UPI00360F9B22